ncbi:MAG: hypothetical protein U0270_30275 [Labilithrix sp.]
MGTNERPARGPLESESDEIPTRILDGAPDLEDDGPTIMHRDEPTIRTEVDTEDLRAKLPPSMRALEAAPRLMPKPPAPAVPAVPVVPVEPPAPDLDPEPPSIITEIGAVPRMVTVPNMVTTPKRAPLAPLMERETENTKKMAAVYVAPTPASAPAPALVPSAPPSDDLPYEVPGLEKSGRGKWLAIALTAIVCVGAGGVAVGRVSALNTPAPSRAPSATTAPAATPPPPPPEPVASAVEPAPSSPSPSPSPPESVAPAPRPIEPERRIAPAPRPSPPPFVARPPAQKPPSGTIVRDNPF